jgi:outer membrane protein TolC
VSGDTYHTPSAWQAQAGVRWKVFDWGQTYFTAQQAEKNARRLAQEYEALRLEVQYEVRQRYLQIAEAAKRLKTAQDGLAAAKESLRMAQARYEAQVGTNTDVLDAQAARTEAETRVIQALADHRLAVVRLLAAMGEGRPSTP